MRSAHTPGPWFYDKAIAGRIVINSDRVTVAVLPYVDREAVANAQIIAASPRMYAYVAAKAATGDVVACDILGDMAKGERT